MPGFWWYLIPFGGCLIIFHVQQPVAFGLYPCPNQARQQSDGRWACCCPSPRLECPLPAPLDSLSSPPLSFIQLLVIFLLIQEIARVWTALSWQLPSGLHLVTQGEESLLVLVWLMELGRVCAEGQQGGGFLPEASCCWTQAGCGRERASEGGVKTLALQICYSFDCLDHQRT